MKILHSADWHINLHKKKVPWDWQWRRFEQFFKELLRLEAECSVHIISGDVFDKYPEPDEVALFLSYIHQVQKPTFIIPGNHEATGVGESWLKHFTGEHKINNSLVEVICYNACRSLDGVNFQFFPYGEMQKKNLPKPIPNHILVTHIRGEVPPHISAEYDFEKLRPWKLILCGDLHFAHKYRDFPLWYSGSPMNVSFDRDDTKEYGVNIIEYDNLDNYQVRFVPLDLPKLLRRTVKDSSLIAAHPVHHIVYEVLGSIDELAKVGNNVLLDKKIVQKPKESSQLDLTGLALVEELTLYLKHQGIDPTPVVEEFKKLGITWT